MERASITIRDSAGTSRLAVLPSRSPVLHRSQEELAQIFGRGRARRELGHPVLRQRPGDERVDVITAQTDARESVRHADAAHDSLDLAGQNLTSVLGCRAISLGAEQPRGL